MIAHGRFVHHPPVIRPGDPSMALQRYDSWPDFLGRRLVVKIGTHWFHGVMHGLQPVSDKWPQVRHTDHPWALMTADGIVLFDPDNPGVEIYSADVLGTLPRFRSLFEQPTRNPNRG